MVDHYGDPITSAVFLGGTSRVGAYPGAVSDQSFGWWRVGMASDASMTTERLLRERLEEAQERNRWLEEALKPPMRPYFPGLRLSRTNEAVLYALLTADAPLNQEKLRRRIDVALGSFDAADAKSVDVVIFRLRRELSALKPPIKVLNAWGRGYWINDESKAQLLRLACGK